MKYGFLFLYLHLHHRVFLLCGYPHILNGECKFLVLGHADVARSECTQLHGVAAEVEHKVERGVICHAHRALAFCIDAEGVELHTGEEEILHKFFVAGDGAELVGQCAAFLQRILQRLERRIFGEDEGHVAIVALIGVVHGCGAVNVGVCCHEQLIF